jgi:hypothetical protein
MTRTATHRIAGLLVLGLVLTSLPVRVWLFGACPVCGQIHVPILVAYVGGDPTPGSDPSDDPPPYSDDDRSPDGCFVPLPYCPTPPPELPVAALPAGGDLRPESDPRAVPLPAAALIRPPRA